MSDPKSSTPKLVFDWSKIYPIIVTAIMAILGTLVAKNESTPTTPGSNSSTVNVTVPDATPAPSPLPVATPTATADDPELAPPLKTPKPDAISKIKKVGSTPLSWIPTNSAGKRIDSLPLEQTASTLTDGTYTVTGIPSQGEAFVTRMISVTTLTAPQPPPKPAPTPTPIPPPLPPEGDVVAHAYFVFVDRWNDRDNSAELQALGPAAAEWAAMRSAGHKVLNLDADSEVAQDLYKPYLSSAPVLLVFDLDAKGPSGGPKFIGPTPVKNLADVRAAYKKATGKDLP